MVLGTVFSPTKIISLVNLLWSNITLNETLPYDVIVRRSFADYLWEWLLDAGQEYGLNTSFK